MLSWIAGLFQKKQADYGMGDVMIVMQREAILRERGWVPFINPPFGSPSPCGRVIEIIDRDDIVTTARYDDISPYWNVAGKFWREYRCDHSFASPDTQKAPPSPKEERR